MAAGQIDHPLNTVAEKQNGTKKETPEEGPASQDALSGGTLGAMSKFSREGRENLNEGSLNQVACLREQNSGVT